MLSQEGEKLMKYLEKKAYQKRNYYQMKQEITKIIKKILLQMKNFIKYIMLMKN